MSYTPNTWSNGDTITAAKLNNIEQGIVSVENNSGGWDAIIRLTHADNSGGDTIENLTPSIISGTFAELTSKYQNGGFPCILVQYYHPWGTRFSAPMIAGFGADANTIYITIKMPFSNTGLPAIWTYNDTIAWAAN